MHLCNEISTHEKHENSLRVEKEFTKGIKIGNTSSHERHLISLWVERIRCFRIVFCPRTFRRYIPKMLVCEVGAPHGDYLRGLHIRG